MCGIAGYFGPRDIPQEITEKCLSLMSHRGPDVAAAFSKNLPGEKNILLLHSRLSIIDLDSRSNQPFRKQQGVLSYNGELYNYLELQKELEQSGSEFMTQSDTEVMITLLNRHGANRQALEAAEGMWAFAYFEFYENSLTLSRDRFGEKPLFMYRDGEGIYFASELKFITCLLGHSLEVNQDQLKRYLVNGYKSLNKSRSTFFRGVEQLAPGCNLTIDLEGRETLVSYWYPHIAPEEDMGWDEAVALAREALLRSMEIRLRADVPMAFCLSGGIDSNALVSIAKKMFGYDVHGFTIVNEDARYEERDIVKMAVTDYEIRHTEIPVDSTAFLERLREQVKHHAAPIGTINYYAQWRLMKSVSQAGYKISVSGTGADELFSGYYDHHLAYLKEVKGDAALYSSALANWRREVQPLVRNPFLKDPDLFVNNPKERGHVYLGAEKFASCLTEPWFESFEEEDYHPDLLRNRMLNELFKETVPVILHEDDLNAMSFSIENRSPFLDRTLFDVAARIPSKHMVKNGRAKAVLREAVRGLVPDAILDNPRKVGFNAPIFSYLDVNDGEVREQLLDDSPVFELIKKEKIKAFFDKKELPNSQSKLLFNFLNCKMFLEEFSESGA